MSLDAHPAHPNIPEWTQGDRLRKARTTAKVSVAVMAAELGVDPDTVRNYEADRTRRVFRAVLKVYADLCRVPIEWLEHGTGPDDGPAPQPDTSPSPSPQTPAGAPARRRTGRGPNSWWSSAPAARVRVSTQRRSLALGVVPLGARCRSAA